MRKKVNVGNKWKANPVDLSCELKQTIFWPKTFCACNE